MPPTSVLSPLAVPFTPSREGFTEFASFDAIYNDGVPQGVLFGAHAAHDIIHNIPDEAIDEIFPPSAADAAELDAVDDFLVTMVDLSFLEEHEEMSRSNYGYLLKKRWEIRRQRGAVKKTHYKTTLATTTILDDVPVTRSHGSMPSPNNEHRMVHYNRHHRVKNHIENRQRLIDSKRLAHYHSQYRNLNNKPCGTGFVHGHSKPIQQPRKMN
mmetsp:Transcript_3365/g.6298  ORF Transcript_3365/g.6298 Transcript_3365/m.6298 type:complete len:212 (+) Transcript_3365:39-674(+)